MKPPDYDKEYKKRYRENVQYAKKQAREFKKQPQKSGLRLKVRNFCKLHAFKEREVQDLIQKNDIVAACFAKNPSKQRIYKHLAAKYIETIVGKDNFDSLVGEKLVLVGGKVMNEDQVMEEDYLNAQAIDFAWKYEGVQFYASHRYTKEEGGGQGRAYRELQNFINEAPRSARKGERFLVIADGKFYEDKDGRDKISRLQHLKELACKSGGPVQVCKINDLKKLLPQPAGQGNRK